ncbi:rod shape-determining protein MreD [Elioraea sp.]|uniref:rod shape-determining protein MreD n=1 Tax=Elioraea sp. TaxID=2185103 RepID=UPI0021DCA2B6|nr:rod shape-determining protein MreD [Elioraea sp.]GIX10611.1 MAG: rod shape-determining protein MreD [Elioraea sp.]
MASPVARPPRPRGFWQRLDQAARDLAPSALTVLLVLAMGIPLGLPAQHGLMPMPAVAAVYFWTLYRPGLMPPLSVFGVGVLTDLLTAAPLGINPLLLLLLHAAVLTQRRVLARQSFLLVWTVFALLAAATLGLGWILRIALAMRLLPAEPALYEFALTVALYPAFSWLFVRIERSLAAAG